MNRFDLGGRIGWLFGPAFIFGFLLSRKGRLSSEQETVVARHPWSCLSSGASLTRTGRVILEGREKVFSRVHKAFFTNSQDYEMQIEQHLSRWS